VLVLVAVVFAGDVATACGPTGDETASGRPGGSTAVSGELTVLAAASLSETFTRLAEDFERDNPGTEETVTFGPSSGLAESIIHGAPAAVFAAADKVSMDRVHESGDVTESIVFARNSLQIAVPRGNPANVDGLADFADEDLLIAICAAEVPCGRAAAAVFDAAGLTPRPDTYGRDVKAVLTAVRTGDVDAGLVYRTDVGADDKVEGIDLPHTAGGTNDYHIAVLADADRHTARAFVELVLSPTGQRVLADAGFELP